VTASNFWLKDVTQRRPIWRGHMNISKGLFLEYKQQPG